VIRFQACFLRIAVLCVAALTGGCGAANYQPVAVTGGSTATTSGGSFTAAGIPVPLRTIPEVQSVNGTATVVLDARFDGNGRPAMFWNGEEVAPTVRVAPGDTIDLTFINELPQYCAVGVESNANLHFHGLSSSPEPPSDDVITTNAVPGGTVHYLVHINPDQPPGMYWYHPHAHGLAAYEVGNGMAGAIIVEGIANAVPRTAGLRERVIVLTDIPNDPSYAAGELAVLRRSAEGSRSAQSLGGPPCSSETTGRPMINGQPLASIGIRPGETELFRVVNASAHRHFDLAVDGQQLQVVAEDGVPLGTYPGSPSTLTVPDIVIPPAARAEFLVTGEASPAALISKCFDSGPGGFFPNPEVVLGLLTSDAGWPAGVTRSVHVNRALAAIRRAQYFQSPMPAPAAERTFTFSSDRNGFYINGQAYSPSAAPQAVAKSGTVEQWTLQNATTEVHVFHIHQTHFIVSSINGQPQASPQWRDTIDLTPGTADASGNVTPSQTNVLIDFRDPAIRGTFLFHCHLLDHEDLGMMAKITVM
jgi:suppressor of ftsI